MRAAAEKQKPSNQRIRGYQDSALPTLEQRLFSSATVYKALDQVELAESPAEIQEALEPTTSWSRWPCPPSSRTSAPRS